MLTTITGVPRISFFLGFLGLRDPYTPKMPDATTVVVITNLTTLNHQKYDSFGLQFFVNFKRMKIMENFLAFFGSTIILVILFFTTYCSFHIVEEKKRGESIKLPWEKK